MIVNFIMFERIRYTYIFDLSYWKLANQRKLYFPQGLDHSVMLCMLLVNSANMSSFLLGGHHLIQFSHFTKKSLLSKQLRLFLEKSLYSRNTQKYSKPSVPFCVHTANSFMFSGIRTDRLFPENKLNGILSSIYSGRQSRGIRNPAFFMRD